MVFHNKRIISLMLSVIIGLSFGIIWLFWDEYAASDFAHFQETPDWKA